MNMATVQTLVTSGKHALQERRSVPRSFVLFCGSAAKPRAASQGEKRPLTLREKPCGGQRSAQSAMQPEDLLLVVCRVWYAAGQSQ